MDETEIAHNIRLAKLDNAQWLKCAEMLLKGKPVGAECTPVYRDQCVSCQWFYEHSEELSTLYRNIDDAEIELFRFDVMEEIEILRYEIHSIYLQLFKHCSPELSALSFTALFHPGQNTADDETIDAMHLFVEMKRMTKELDGMLERLEYAFTRLCILPKV